MSSEIRFTDFKSDKHRTWCLGCGDFGTMNGMMKALAETGNDPDNTFVVAGIGCSGKIGTYMHSYTLHGVHGRVLPVGISVKLANPDLEVMVGSGDGDRFSDPRELSVGMNPTESTNAIDFWVARAGGPVVVVGLGTVGGLVAVAIVVGLIVW